MKEGLDRWLGNESLLAIAIETCALIEAHCGFIFPTSEQHDLVAPLRPSKLQGVGKNGPAVALATELRVRDHVFDDPVRPARTGEVWNDHDRAA